MVRLFTGKSSWSLSLATSSYACAMPTCRPTVFLSGKGTNPRGKQFFAKLSLNTDPEPAVSSGCPRNGKTHAKTGRRDADRMGDCRTNNEDNAGQRGKGKDRYHSITALLLWPISPFCLLFPPAEA